MSAARTLLGTALALALAGPAYTQGKPYPATVLTDGAEVRCKPGTQPAVYVTQRLPRGATVEVVERLADGWLKIDPPDGSFSWVNTRFLRQAGGTANVWVVTATDEPVTSLVGAWGRRERPNAVGATLARGSQLIAVGTPLQESDGYWLPVMAPAGEFRYLREQDVSASPGGARTAAATTTAHENTAAAVAGPADLRPVPAAVPPLLSQAPEIHVGGPPPATPGTDPLLQQAQRLEKDGDRLGAARLYDQLADRYGNSNREAAAQYRTHAAWLRGANAPGTTAAANEGNSLYQQALQAERSGNWPEAIRCYSRLGDMYSGSYYSVEYYGRANSLRQQHPAPAAGAAPTTAPPAPGVGPTAPPPSASVTSRVYSSTQSVGPGYLTRSTSWIDGQSAFVLESAQGQVLAFLTPLTAEARADLERYAGKNVKEVIGYVEPRADVQGRYMKVVRVTLLPASP